MLKPILALGFTGAAAFLFLLSRDKANVHSQETDDYDFIMPSLARIGFLFMTAVPFALSLDYETRIKNRLAELFGRRRLATFYEIHWAQRLVLVGTTAWLLGMVALMGEVEAAFCLFGISLLALVFYWADRELDRKLQRKKREILKDLPELLNTLTLLVNAGLPFSAALQKTVRDQDLRRPLYRELNTLLAEIQTGKPMNQAYEDLAQRCKMPEVTRFVSTVLQNLSRGSADLVHVLRTLSLEAWERRKDIARKQGEEASAKLVVPMVMVFVAVSIIVMAPAIITMGR
jgi:tight adherence protein C